MPRLTDDEIDRLLSGGRWDDGRPADGLCRIGTVSADGWPSVIPVGFAYQDRTLFITAREKDKWLANIRHDPRVCVSVDSSDYSRRKVTITGNARVVFEPGQDDEWRDLRRPMPSPDWTGPKLLDDGREEWSWTEAYSVMTWDEPRALVGIPLGGSTVTSWRMPDVGEYLHEAWSSSYYGEPARRFLVSALGPTPETWKVVSADD